MEEKKVPALRFRGFDNAWEQCKVSEIFKIARGYVLAATETADIKDDKNCYPVYSSQTKNEGLMGFYSEYLYENTITWTTDGANAGTVRYRSGKFYCTNVCGILLSEEGYANKAVSEALNSVAWKYVSYVGNPKLMNNVMADIEIVIPKSVKEQETISRYFDEIDDLIILHQRKLEMLKKVKKSMLEKMFPKNDAKVPELRFSDFTDAWEQHKLSELADIVGGGTPSTAISEYWDGDIDWYAPAEIADQIFVNLSQKKITTEGLNNSSAKMLPVGTVLFTSRAGIGKTAILTKEGCTNQGFQSIIPHKDELDSYFVFSRTDELKRYGETVGAGSTFVEVSGKQMANMTIYIPATMGEQRQIGTYFRNLDNLIILHQRKLEKLKNIKKSMLEKMFII